MSEGVLTLDEGGDGSDYILPEDTGVWITRGPFAVYIYTPFEQEGMMVEVHNADDVEGEPIEEIYIEEE